MDDPGRGGKAAEATISGRARAGTVASAAEPAGWVIETTVSPFHCLYQDWLDFHKQSHLRLARSESEASRLARAAFLLYVEAAEALVHQAAVELGRPDLAPILSDPDHPLPTRESWRLLPAIVAGSSTQGHDPDAPWPQFAELLALCAAWVYPGPAERRRAYYIAPQRDGGYEPLQPHQVPASLAGTIGPEALQLPRTGLPRDPYAIRPRHLDTTRGVLDAAIEALDRRLGGALTRDARHRREPVRLVEPGRGP